MQDITSSCKKLKLLRIICTSVVNTPLTLSEILPNHNLEQLYIVSKTCDVPDTFMSSISAHGGLVHVFLSVASVSVVGISVLIENSPKLITFHCLLKCIYDVDGRRMSDKVLTKFLGVFEQKFHCHRVCCVGGYKIMQRSEHTQLSLYSQYLQYTDLHSL